MKRIAGLTALALAMVMCGLAFSQDPPAQETTEKKLERLEKELVATRERAESLATTLARMQVALDGTLKYLAAQAEQSKHVAKALDESEAAGFTYGINPNSRMILLAAWREQLARVQAEVPQMPPEPEPPKAPDPDKWTRRPLPPRR